MAGMGLLNCCPPSNFQALTTPWGGTMERKGHWEKVYQQKRSDEVSWYQQHPEYSLALIRAAGIAENDPIIDVGGGASHLVDTLLQVGYRDISVLDIAATALAHAQTRLAEKAGQVTWLESDVTAFSPPRRYALWHDRAVFHFLTDPGERARYLDVLTRALSAGGHAIIATFALDGPEQCSNLPVERYDADKLTKVLGAGFSLVETRSEAHITPTGKNQHFLYFHVVRHGPN